jgi:CPA2 family monovalent cation:H+ antiporter-2
MHPDLALVTNITMAVLVAFIGGIAARKVGLPSLVGYVLAGLAISPFTPGFSGDVKDISQLAEMGVVFMMFGVGLHFSLRDLWRVRSIAIPGAFMQMTLGTLLGLGVSQLWGWSPSAGLLLGFSISIASTVVLLRGLEDNGLINTPHGQVAIGWLVFEDLATIAILVVMPALFGDTGGNILESGGIALLKTGAFVAVMMLVGTKLMPWLLVQIARTRSRELFILAVVVLSLGTALGAAEFFGVSLALGAFLAGVVVGESDLSHQVGAEVLPFREVFTVLFFVSVGMLVDPRTFVSQGGQILGLAALIVGGKGLITLFIGFFLPCATRTVLVVAAGLSQIGEFSFILGQAGLALKVFERSQYSLMLSASLLSIVLNPLLYRLIPRAEKVLQRIPGLWRRLERGGPAPDFVDHGLTDHVVIVGYGRVSQHIVAVLNLLEVPHLVVEQDAERAVSFQELGVPTLFGDASNSEILTHAGLGTAKVLIVAIPNESTASLVVHAAKAMAPELPIIARAATAEGVAQLQRDGARDVIYPELEGGLEVVRHALSMLGYDDDRVRRYTEQVRLDAYSIASGPAGDQQVLTQLFTPGPPRSV